MKNMKTILKEWRSFLSESEKPYPTSIAGRGAKYLSSLQTRTDITKEEALRIEAAYYIVSALSGFKGNKKFFKKYSFVVLDVLDSLAKLVKQFITTNQNVSNDLFGLYATGAQREKTGSREKINSVAYILEFKDLAAHNVDFYAEEDLEKYVEIMSEMVENKDYDFGLFKKPEERKRFFDTKPRSHDQGTGGIQKPPGLSPQEDEEFEAMGRPYFKAAGALLGILTMRPKPTKKEVMELRLAEAEQAAIFKQYLYELWSAKTDPSKYFNSTMIRMYKNGARDARIEADRIKVDLDMLEPTPEEKVEDLIVKARAGDKEAAKEARKILISLGRSQEAREMRRLSR